MDPRRQWVVPLSDTADWPENLIGGKAAKLVRACSNGLIVPRGFCVTTRAYEEFLDKTGLVSGSDDSFVNICQWHLAGIPRERSIGAKRCRAVGVTCFSRVPPHRQRMRNEPI